jgi:serine/threonine protein kinase/Flp pilus assembly protein TadD
MPRPGDKDASLDATALPSEDGGDSRPEKFPRGSMAAGESSPSETSLVGTQVGAYEILSHLGAGAMGDVYRGVHKQLQRPVAIKALKPEIAISESLVGRFFAEARAVNLIRHENIVECTDMIRDQLGRSFMVMELLDGKTLGELKASVVKLPWPRAVKIAAQIADAIAAAHEKGIIHRDLKPDNVFLIKRRETDDYVKILDFGIAHLKPEQGGHSATQTGAALGTPAYMSPEQVRGEKVTAAADIYCLGVMLFELITGELPFNGESAAEVMVGHLSTPPPDISQSARIPSPLASLVNSMLCKAQDERPPSMAEIADQLHALAGKGSVKRGSGRLDETPESVDGQAETAPAPQEEAKARGGDSDVSYTAIPAQSQQGGSGKGLWLGLAGLAVAGAVVAVVMLGGGGDSSDSGGAGPEPGRANSATAVEPDDGGSREAFDLALREARLPATPAECQTIAGPELAVMTEATAKLAGGSLAEIRDQDREAARQLAEASPRSAEGLALLGRARLLTGDRTGAIEAADRAIGECPTLALAHGVRGTALMATEQDQAIESLAAAVEHDSGYSDARFNLGLLLDAKGRAEESLAQFNAIALADDGFPNIQLMRGKALLETGKLDQAIEALRKASTSSSDPGLAQLYLGHALKASGDDNAANVAFCVAADGGRSEARDLCDK